MLPYTHKFKSCIFLCWQHFQQNPEPKCCQHPTTASCSAPAPPLSSWSPAPATCSVLGEWRKELPSVRREDKNSLPPARDWQEGGRRESRWEDTPGTGPGPGSGPEPDWGPPGAHACRVNRALSGVESTPSFLTILPPLLCKPTLAVGSAGQAAPT